MGLHPVTSPVIPVTGRTPVYGIEYQLEGEPAFHYRAKMERNAPKLEAALLAAGAAPPGGSTWATVSADSGWLDWPGPRPANWTWVAGIAARYRILGRQVYVQAEVSSSAAWAANVLLTTLPAGARPGRAWWFPGVGYGGAAMPAYVDAAGGVRLANAGAAGAGGWLTTCFPIG